jgi:integrase
LWQYSIDLGKDEAGKRQRRYFYAKTRTDLLRKVGDEGARAGGTIRPRAKGTVGEWVERWLRDDVKPNLSANTYAQYETMWRVHAAPFLSSTSLQKVDVPHVERLYTTLRERGVSSAVLQRVAAVMSRAIEVAIRRRKYFNGNPFAIVEKPKHRYKEARVLDVAEACRFVVAAQGDRYEALWVVLLTSGLRLGEALGLEWADVDLDRGSLAVRQAVSEVRGPSRVGALKTRGSRRRIELGALAVAALRRRKTAVESEAHGSKFIFTTTTGGHPKRSPLRQRHFAPVCQAAGITGLTIHGLRHSMTSLALADGISPKVIAERLGHSTVRLTQDRYQHVLPGLQRRAAEAIDALLKG